MNRHIYVQGEKEILANMKVGETVVFELGRRSKKAVACRSYRYGKLWNEKFHAVYDKENHTSIITRIL